MMPTFNHFQIENFFTTFANLQTLKADFERGVKTKIEKKMGNERQGERGRERGFERGREGGGERERESKVGIMAA